MNPWPQPGNGASGNDQIIDLVIVLAAHPCQSVDVLLFDQQRVQIDTSAAPSGAAAGSGTSFTPVQQTVKYTGSNPTRIKRTDGVVTVTLSNNIPYLIVGDHVQLSNVPGDLTLNGTFQVAQILSQVAGSPGSITFTFLSGGPNSDVVNAGWVTTLWANYGRTVYFEPLLGAQTLGQTFAGMTQGTPLDGDMGNFARPEHAGDLGSNAPNPWTQYCSLQGKTAVFLRLHYDAKYYKGGLPQISFLMKGKNDILDPRTSPPTRAYSENAALCIADFLANETWGYKALYGTEIPYAELIAAANTCDEAVPLRGAASPPQTEPAYTCNGKFNLTMKRGEILQNLLTSCAGRLTYVGGRYVIWPAAWTGNSFAIGSNPGGGVVSLPAFAQIAAGPIRWRPTVSIRDLYNGVKGTYISQANKWMPSDFPPYCQDALHGYSGPSLYEGDANLAADGGDRRWKDIQLPFTISASMAQRIAKIELLRSRQFGTGMLILNMVGYQIAPMDLILATIPYLGWTGKQLEVLEERFRIEESRGEDGAGPVLVVEIDIQETASSVYDWDTNEELSAQGYQQPGLEFKFFAAEQVPGFTTPYPWAPGYVAPLVGDALFPGPVAGSPPRNEGRARFGMQVQYGTDAQGNATASLEIKGVIPPNRLSDIDPPQISCVAGTSGHLPAGTYVVAASAFDTETPAANSKFSVPSVVTIPVSSPANNGSIAVTVSWPDGSNGGEIYLAGESAAAGYHFQSALTSAETTRTITDFDQATDGGPDSTFDHLAVVWKKVAHSGRFAAQVQAVTSNTITLGGAGMTVNQWAGDVISLLGKLDSTEELIILNMLVASSTASSGSSPGPPEFVLTIGANANGDTLPDLSTLLVVGDLLVMRFNATFTPTSFSDPKIANPYYPDGATGIEAGRLAMVLTGPDAGDVQTIASVSLDGFGKATIFELAGTWATQPDDGDLVIVVEAGWSPEAHTQGFPVPNRGASIVAAAPLVANLASQTWLFLVRAQTADDLNGADAYAPTGEIYVFGSQGTRTISTSQDMLATDRIIDVDATGGAVVYSLLPFAQSPNQSLFIQKIDSGSNAVTWVCAAGDTVNGHSSGILKDQWDYAVITISGNG